MKEENRVKKFIKEHKVEIVAGAVYVTGIVGLFVLGKKLSDNKIKSISMSSLKPHIIDDCDKYLIENYGAVIDEYGISSVVKEMAEKFLKEEDYTNYSIQMLEEGCTAIWLTK